jgi:O-antigen/teichoic acid export membrane protein
MMEQVENKSYIKELFSLTSIYGISLFLNKIVSFFLLPIYTNYFQPEELGLYNLIQSFWLFIIIFYVYGLETSFLKFFIDGKADEEKTKIYSTTLILITTTSLIFSLILYNFSGYIAQLFSFNNTEKGIHLIKLISILLFFDAISRFPLLLLRAELKAKIYLFLTILTLFLNIVCNIVFIMLLHYNIESIFISYIISSLIPFIIGLIFTKKYLSFIIETDVIKSLLKFGNKFIYVGIFILIIDVSDRFFLKYFWDERVVGVYSTSYKLASVMNLIISAFKFTWTPYFLHISENPENKRIISNIFTYFIFAGSFLFLFFSFFIDSIVKTEIFGISFITESYRSGLSILPIILLSYFFSGLFANLNAAPFFTDKTKYIFWVCFIGFIINILLNTILIPLFKMYGAAYATLGAYFSMFLMIFLVSQKIYHIEYEWTKLIKIVIVVAMTYAAEYAYEVYSGSRPLYRLLIKLSLFSLSLIIISQLKVVAFSKINILFKRKN